MRRGWLGVFLASIPLAAVGQVPLVQTPSGQMPSAQPPAAQSAPAQDRRPPRRDPPAVIRAPRDGEVNPAPLPPATVPMPDDDGGAPDVVQVDPKARAAASVGQPRRGTWVQMGTATVQALDKVNARGQTLAIKVGETGHYGSLDITVRGCFVRGPDQPADASALLVIRDQKADSPAFTGWMVRSAPYMSMLAHPIFDVRVAGCSP